MGILTIFFCGTGCSVNEGESDNPGRYGNLTGYIPVRLARLLRAKDSASVLCLKGPGVGVGALADAWDTAVAGSMSETAQAAASWVSSNQGDEPPTINMLAHSRGAVIAVMAANLICEANTRARVRIFAIDPVPGPGRLTEHMYRLPAGVLEYVIVIAEDETSAGFNGLLPLLPADETRADPMREVRRVFISRGRHATVAGNNTVDGAAGTRSDGAEAAGTLVFLLACITLRDWGADPGPHTLAIPTTEALRQRVRNARADFTRMREHVYVPTGGLDGERRRGMAVPTGDGDMPNWCYLNAFNWGQLETIYLESEELESPREAILRLQREAAEKRERQVARRVANLMSGGVSASEARNLAISHPGLRYRGQ